MKRKHITISIVLAALMLVSLFSVAGSATGVSGQASGKTIEMSPPDGILAGTGPAASSSFASGQWYIYAVDTNGALWYTQYGNSSTWTSLGGLATASPAAVSWGTPSSPNSNLRIDVFVRGTDGAVWQKYYNNTVWSGWHALGGQLASGTGPAVSSYSAGRLDVFAEGTNGALYHKWWNGKSWSAWESLGGHLTASPAATWDVAASPASNNIYVFVRGTDGACWSKVWSGAAWSGWHSLGGQLEPNTGPAVSQDLNLFVQGIDGQLWHWNGGTTWGTLGGAPPETLSTASPGAVLLIDDNTIVCVGTTSGNVWYSGPTYNFNDWSSAGSPL